MIFTDPAGRLGIFCVFIVLSLVSPQCVQLTDTHDYCITYRSGQVTWSEGYRQCKAVKGNLLIPDDANKLQLIKKFLRYGLRNNNIKYWLSAKYMYTNWAWIYDDMPALQQGCYTSIDAYKLYIESGETVYMGLQKIFQQYSRERMSSSTCIGSCRERNAMYAGFKFSIGCFCGNGQININTLERNICDNCEFSHDINKCKDTIILYQLSGVNIDWGAYQPNNWKEDINENQNCGAIAKDKSFRLIDEQCYKKFRYLCETGNSLNPYWISSMQDIANFYDSFIKCKERGYRLAQLIHPEEIEQAKAYIRSQLKKDYPDLSRLQCVYGKTEYKCNFYVALARQKVYWTENKKLVDNCVWNYSPTGLTDSCVVQFNNTCYIQDCNNAIEQADFFCEYILPVLHKKSVIVKRNIQKPNNLVEGPDNWYSYRMTIPSIKYNSSLTDIYQENYNNIFYDLYKLIPNSLNQYSIIREMVPMEDSNGNLVIDIILTSSDTKENIQLKLDTYKKNTIIKTTIPTPPTSKPTIKTTTSIPIITTITNSTLPIANTTINVTTTTPSSNLPSAGASTNIDTTSLSFQIVVVALIVIVLIIIIIVIIWYKKKNSASKVISVDARDKASRPCSLQNESLFINDHSYMSGTITKVPHTTNRQNCNWFDVS
ncbi:hypothetical protein A3Q56_03465 [Intoshia linei]|uniref:C-type lectin domain-containing protein n=1 Tax=Intoshia linei TaxID=1819745 RepID=A0A177B5A8_9BILA|nr:hypothetical protein A3Q56_03465 [Intoshia linei]